MRRIALALATVLAAALTAAPSLAAPDAADADRQPVIKGFFDGHVIRYFDYGPIKLQSGNRLSVIYVIANGPSGQRSVVSSVPGDARYSPLRRVVRVTWRRNQSPRILRSAAEVQRAAHAGQVRIRRTATILNSPVLGYEQERHPGFARDKTIHYYELGVVKVAPGNEVLPIWTFTNGVDGQRNIADTEPGITAYPPLWAVVEVTWADGVTPRLITSFEALEQAHQAGEVSFEETSLVVNCPFV